jgi:hypothetical protein
VDARGEKDSAIMSIVTVEVQPTEVLVRMIVGSSKDKNRKAIETLFMSRIVMTNTPIF